MNFNAVRRALQTLRLAPGGRELGSLLWWELSSARIDHPSSRDALRPVADFRAANGRKTAKTAAKAAGDAAEEELDDELEEDGEIGDDDTAIDAAGEDSPAAARRRLAAVGGAGAVWGLWRRPEEVAQSVRREHERAGAGRRPRCSAETHPLLRSPGVRGGPAQGHRRRATSRSRQARPEARGPLGPFTRPRRSPSRRPRPARPPCPCAWPPRGPRRCGRP